MTARLSGPGYTLRAIKTPGHTMNHVCFELVEERALFTGDHIMGWSTSIVAPPDGAMRLYLDSLEKLRAFDHAVYWPGHGGPVAQPQRFLRALLHHRRAREKSILAALESGPLAVPQIVEKVYEKLDPRLKGAAALSTFAHLEDLCARGLVGTERAPQLTDSFRVFKSIPAAAPAGFPPTSRFRSESECQPAASPPAGMSTNGSRRTSQRGSAKVSSCNSKQPLLLAGLLEAKACARRYLLTERARAASINSRQGAQVRMSPSNFPWLRRSDIVHLSLR